MNDLMHCMIVTEFNTAENTRCDLFPPPFSKAGGITNNSRLRTYFMQNNPLKNAAKVTLRYFMCLILCYTGFSTLCWFYSCLPFMNPIETEAC